MGDMLLIEVWATMDPHELQAIHYFTLHNGIETAADEIAHLRTENQRLREEVEKLSNCGRKLWQVAGRRSEESEKAVKALLAALELKETENQQLRELVKMYDDLLIATQGGELPDIPILEDMEKLKSQLGMFESQEE